MDRIAPGSDTSPDYISCLVFLQPISLKYIIHLNSTPMITTIIILAWLLLGAITFGIACNTGDTIFSFKKQIIITLFGPIAFVTLIIHIIQEDHDELSKRLKKLNKTLDKTLKCIIIFACAIVFSSCSDVVGRVEYNERQTGYSAVVVEYSSNEYKVLNDTVALRITDNAYFSKRRAIPSGEWRYYRAY